MSRERWSTLTRDVAADVLAAYLLYIRALALHISKANLDQYVGDTSHTYFKFTPGFLTSPLCERIEITGPAPQSQREQPEGCLGILERCKPVIARASSATSQQPFDAQGQRNFHVSHADPRAATYDLHEWLMSTHG